VAPISRSINWRASSTRFPGARVGPGRRSRYPRRGSYRCGGCSPLHSGLQDRIKLRSSAGRTIVIGRGETRRSDAAIAAKSSGRGKIPLWLIGEAKSEMPAFEFEYDLRESVWSEVQWNAAPVRIVVKTAGRGVEFAYTESGGHGSGLRIIEGANFTIGCAHGNRGLGTIEAGGKC